MPHKARATWTPKTGPRWTADALPRTRPAARSAPGGVGNRAHPGRPQGAALRDARGGPGLSRSLGRALGRHPDPRHEDGLFLGPPGTRRSHLAHAIRLASSDPRVA